MASSSSNTNEGPLKIRSMDLHDPNKDAIAVVLGEALRENYMESSVDWVTSYPNLSLPPFNLAAQGICGNTALLDFGDMSYLNELVLEHKYNFKKFLKNIYRDKRESFIFGHGTCIFRNKLRELVLNTSFLPATSNEEPESKNKSRLTYINSTVRKCVTETINLNDLICDGQGTYFLCDGLKTDESVLRVHVKGLRLINTPSLEGKRFINSMQEALQRNFGNSSEQFVALGGVYTVENAEDFKHALIPKNWEELKRSTVLGYYCRVNPCETMITIFSSSKNLQLIEKRPPIILNSCQSMHSLSHHSSSVDDFRISDPTKVEYFGYFSPATQVYRIDYPI